MVAVVIPIYRSEPSPLEVVSLRRCCAILSGHDVVFFGPNDLDTSWYRNFCRENARISFESFDRDYFVDIEGYSRLLISAIFYERFLKYDFILIHQLDAYVFEDTLHHWCQLNFDFIGAPWVDENLHKEICNGIKVTIFRRQTFLMRQLMKVIWKIRGLAKPDNLRVGNGGLSLRKTRVFHQIASVSRKPESPVYNEDLFWSIHIPLTTTGFRIADFTTALAFSFDSHPARCLELNKGKLPFATHGWFRDEDVYKGNLAFWKSYITIA